MIIPVSPILALHHSYHRDNSTTMKQHRESNPKPKYFNLMNKWNLSEEERMELEYYKLKKISSHNLAINLQQNGGCIHLNDFDAGDQGLFNPIYQNCSQNLIKEQFRSSVSYRYEYWLSFRKSAEFNVVLIQPVRT